MTEWAAYYSCEPWGEERADWRSATLAAILANQWRGREDRPAEPADFVPDFLGEGKQAAQAMDLEQTLAWARGLAGRGE